MAGFHNFSVDIDAAMINPRTIFSESQIQILNTVLPILLSIVTAFYIHHDYRAFLSLGPGGTPSTPLGYVKIKLLSLVCLRDPLHPAPIPPHFRPQQGYLRDDSLPKRPGKRPVVQGVAPQRQQTEKSEKSVYTQLIGRIQELAGDSRNRLTERTSCFEKHSTGLFTTVPLTEICRGEICHAHPSDGSMHMSLHPADAKLMLENGWGERHPLARGGWCRRFVPKEFVLIYAPRNESEVEIVMRIVAASIWWVSGIDVNWNEEDSRKRRRADAAAVGKAMEGQECWACKVHGWTGGKVEKMADDS